MTSSLESPICVGAASSTFEVKLLMDKKALFLKTSFLIIIIILVDGL
jgi:hypothetical protein